MLPSTLCSQARKTSPPRLEADPMPRRHSTHTMPPHLPDGVANGGFRRWPLSSSRSTYDIGQTASKRNRPSREVQKLPHQNQEPAELSAESTKTIPESCNPMSSFKLTFSGNIGIHLLRCATFLALPGTLPFQQEADRQ